ncbi:MAG: sigma-70 family RNA polymerase sigma factor [Ginsengibacter sp.]
MIDNEQNKLLNFHIKKCFYNNRDSQKYIFRNYYFYVKSICQYYSMDDDELESLINKCFLRAFKNLPHGKTYDDVSFQKWLRKWAVCVIVDYSRKNFRHQEIINFKHAPVVNPGILWKRFLSKISPVFQKRSPDEIHWAISNLTPSSRIILNLMALEEFNYNDLANCFGVTINIATDNAAKAIGQVKNIMSPLNAKAVCK